MNIFIYICRFFFRGEYRVHHHSSCNSIIQPTTITSRCDNNNATTSIQFGVARSPTPHGGADRCETMLRYKDKQVVGCFYFFNELLLHNYIISFDGSGDVINVKRLLQTKKAFTNIIIAVILHVRSAGVHGGKLGPCGEGRLYFFAYLTFPRNIGKDISQ
jgi:hypothetical protein